MASEEKIQLIPLGEIKPYEDAPFKVRLDENMEELVESIKENGVLVPTIARPHTDGGVEMLAGHRRLKACELAGLDKLPVIVKDLDDDTAIILLVDSNIHREDILPSEKAFAYQMKLEAMKRQGKRSDLTCEQVAYKSDKKKSSEILGEQVGESKDQIRRYIRLTNLIDPTPMTTEERLMVLHDFYRGSEEQTLELDIKRSMRLGHDIIDYICPDSLEFKSDHFRMGDKYGRVMFLKDLASFIKDSMVSEITDFSRNLMFSIDILPIPTDEAVKEVQKKILGVETDITRWQQKQNMNNNFSANIPYEMEQMRKDLKEFLDDLTTRDQRMMSALITVVHTADTLEKLNEDTETILSIGRKHLCQFSILKWQQEDGLKTALPYGIRKIDALRTLTTESTAVFMPFKTQEIMDRNGLFYGVNAISHNLILCNRKNLQNGNGWILGVPGSGKSFFAKFEMILNALYNTEDDIIIVDPEGEYAPIIKMLGGERIIISAASNNHINALEMVKDYGDGDNPINVKAQFIMSLYEQIVGAGRVKAQERSIIDRAVAKIYEEYMIDYTGEPPTLVDFHNTLKTFSEPEARDIALAMELFTEGSLNAFAHQSNVNVNNRIVCYDILDLGEQLKPVGLLVMLDNIMNRVIANRHKGKYTHTDNVMRVFK